MTKRVLVAEDFPVMRDALVECISRADDFEVVAVAETGRSTVERARSARPDIVVVDVQMPDVDGLSALRQLRTELPQTRFVAITASEQDGVRSSAMAAGAHDFVTKRTAAAELVQRLRGLESAVARRPTAPGTVTLDETERAVVGYLADGLTDQQIGEQLFVSTRTVQNYLVRVRRKTGTQRRCDIVRWASENRWV